MRNEKGEIGWHRESYAVLGNPMNTAHLLICSSSQTPLILSPLIVDSSKWHISVA